MYPEAIDPSKIGDYPAVVGGGGGYVWDEVLEYRVWCHPKDGSEDFYYVYATYDEACQKAIELRDSDDSLALVEDPLALVLQREHINESEPGMFEHVTTERMTEWSPEYLSRPRRTPDTIPEFFAPDAPDAPENRLDIIRGLA